MQALIGSPNALSCYILFNIAKTHNMVDASSFGVLIASLLNAAELHDVALLCDFLYTSSLTV